MHHIPCCACQVCRHLPADSMCCKMMLQPPHGLAANSHAALQPGQTAAQRAEYSNPCAADITPTRQSGARLENTLTLRGLNPHLRFWKRPDSAPGMSSSSRTVHYRCSSTCSSTGCICCLLLPGSASQGHTSRRVAPWMMHCRLCCAVAEMQTSTSMHCGKHKHAASVRRMPQACQHS